jgi:hypothetical protein
MTPDDKKKKFLDEEFSPIIISTIDFIKKKSSKFRQCTLELATIIILLVVNMSIIIVHTMIVHILHITSSMLDFYF